MNAPLVFFDTETTGLALDDDIWEFAGIRREPDGTEEVLHLFIEHDLKKCADLPGAFREDHLARFPGHSQFASRRDAAWSIFGFLRPDDGGEKPHVVGAVPNFDTERLALLLTVIDRLPPWHYHLIDVENLAVGYLYGVVRQATDQLKAKDLPFDALKQVPDVLTRLPWDSDELSRTCGVEPPGEGERHTALGDARWAMRLYDAIEGGTS